MTDFDDIIHQSMRLQNMSALPIGAGIEFARLELPMSATDGNLGAHIETLTKAGYVRVEKAFVGKRPQTTVFCTSEGENAFRRHVRTLREILEKVTLPPHWRANCLSC